MMKTKTNIQTTTRRLAWVALVLLILYIIMAMIVSYRRIEYVEGYKHSLQSSTLYLHKSNAAELYDKQS